jgi:hypothetical protein
MKKIRIANQGLTAMACLLSVTMLADEGMWMPQLIEALNHKDMKKNGLRLSAEQIYSVNKASMKDAVAIFGGGCSSEIISMNGLLLTNHHCGFSSIAGLSTVEKDYLKNGYFAMKPEEELHCKGLSVTFIRRIDDVTQKITGKLTAGLSDTQKDSTIQATIKTLEAEAKKGTHYDAFIRPFYYGNEYYLFVTEVFRDIRLVGTPPEAIGKFGGETDNWMWPRHNADFSLFRIYAGADNKPADHNAANRPYKPLYSFPISLKGAEPGDFTMVYGFPGRTQEYLTSYAVDLLMNQQDPLRVALREKRLEVLDADMSGNDTIRLMYTARYAGIANYYKKWKGEMMGLKRSDAVTRKREFENKFLDQLSFQPDKRKQYETMLREIEKLCKDYAPLSRQMDYFTECLLGVDGIRMVGSFSGVFTELKKKQSGRENRYAELFKSTAPQLPFKNYNTATDRKLFTAMMSVYIKEVAQAEMPAAVDSMLRAHGYDINRLAEFLYTNSRFVENKKAILMFADFEQNVATYEQDPYYRFASAIYSHYQKTVLPQATYIERQINELQKDYMQGLRENLKDRKFYPDANGTMRIAYGKVEGYRPRDGVEYAHYTTMQGIAEKNSGGEEDYFVQEKLLALHAKKDYGKYADKSGRLRTAFIGSNHTTGGNSGSPVINARGELIGTNFDRNWEGTMSDVMYNVNFCRNIVLDIRYTLWIIDRYAGAGYLLEEMKINK